MKKIYTLYGVCLLALIAVAVLYPHKQHYRKTKSDPEKGEENPLKLAQYLHLRYADPATGKVPFGGAYKAYQQLVARGLMPAQLRVERSASSNGWQLVSDLFPSLAITMITYDPQHPNVFYFCTGEGWGNLDEAAGAGIFKSTDGGVNWRQLPSTDTSIFDYCQDIKVHPITGDLYVATKHSGLMRSKDTGATWHEVLGATPYQTLGDTSMCNIAFTKNGGIFCTGGIFQSGGIYYSDSGDSGTWVKQSHGAPTAGIYRVQIATAPSNDSVAYAVACNTVTSEYNNSTGYPIRGIYKTTNKGATWSTLPMPGNNIYLARVQAWYDLALAVDPNDDSVVIAGGWELWRSRDGGQTWLQLADGQPDSTIGQYVHVDQHEIVFIGSDTVLFGNDGGIWESDDFTDPSPIIYSRNYGYRVTQFYQSDINPLAGNNFLCGGTQDNGTPAMQNSGISTYFDLSWADGGFCAINYINPGIIYTTPNNNGVYRFTNNELSARDTITNPYLTDANTEFINPMVMDPNNPEIIYMASDKGLWRLTNASTAKDSDWTQACEGDTAISAIGISKSQPNTVYIGYENTGTIYRIVNADTTGKTSVPIYCDPNRNLPVGDIYNPVYISSIRVDPANVNHVFAVYSNYGINNIWETHNATSSSPLWTAQNGDLPNLPVNDVFLNPGDTNVCYAATDLGVFYTTQLNGSSTQWLLSNQGLPNVRTEMFKYRPSDNAIIVATHGRGIFQSTLNISNTGSYALTWTERGPFNVGGRTRTIMVDPNDPSHHKIWAGSVSGGLWWVNNIDSLPATSGINSPITQQQGNFNCYPNPFNNLVHFTFNVPANSENNILRIFDMNGKVVQQINCQGQNHLDWQPTAGAAPGLYFAELLSGNNKYVQKIIYLK
jgi:trimeric autotransporter adhesin